MVDFGELWRQEAQVRRAPDDACVWDARAKDFVSKYGPSGYSLEFLRLAQMRPGESVFDMGCGAGALAIPCVQRGHAVLAADFSPMMLRRCRADTPAEYAHLLQTKLLAWDDDWEAAGLQENSFDLGFASRSIATSDMEAAIRKLSRVTRRKVCVTLVSGKSPRVSSALFADLGLSCSGHQDAAFCFGIATQLGYEPEVQFINSMRADCFSSPEEAANSYVDMLRFADEKLEGDRRAQAEADARAWVSAHLQSTAKIGEHTAGSVGEVERDLPYRIDVPRTFSWAFISWDV